MRKFLHEFTEGTNGDMKDNGWWEIIGSRVFNRFGGCHTYEPSPNDIIVECDDWSDLDWSCLLSNDSSYGWIDRDGTFYRCDYRKHQDLAELYFHSTERDLERQGYIKIYRGHDTPISMYFEYSSAKFLTDAQKTTLGNLGFVEDEDFF